MIIITGASGFVGQNLVSNLKDQGIQIFKISLRNNNWHNEILEGGQAIIHLAGKAHDTSNVSNPEEYYEINRNLTIDLFDRFLQSDIKDFFFFSSVKAVADTINEKLDENVIPCPLTPYGKSKLEAEHYLLSKKLPAGKRLFIIRPCMIHGPGNKGNLNLLYKVVQWGIPWPLASFRNERSFLSVDNLCYLINEMIKSDKISSGVYNFADDESLSTNELVTLIADSLGKKAKLWKIPTSLIKAFVKIGDILPLPLNSERLKKLTESYVVSNYKVKEALGINCLPLSAKDGLKKTVLFFRYNNK